MRRQPNGVNLDEGIALQTREELDLLYYEEGRREIIARIVKWFGSEESEALLVGGQIGVGKSTLLRALVEFKECRPDIAFAFDREAPFSDPGGFWGYALAKLVQTALGLRIAIPEGFAPDDFPDVATRNWEGICRFVTQFPTSVRASDQLREGLAHIAGHTEIAERQCRGILTAIQERLGRSPTILCEGIDKFSTGSPALQSLTPILNLLSGFKTLIEANAVHLFGRNNPWQEVPPLFMTPFSPQEIEEILLKRLGMYHESRRSVLPAIAGFSGGNPRQALRLLMSYNDERGAKRAPVEQALAGACNRVRKDYLYLSFEAVPVDVLTAVERDGFVRSGLVAGVGVVTPMGQSIYRNWVILAGEPAKGDQWKARLNPLVEKAHWATEGLPDSPETAAIKKWAAKHDVSPYGLDIDTKASSNIEAMKEVASSVSSMEALNIVDLLEAISSSLFATDRRDRVLISYREAEAMAIAKDYLLGKANELGYRPAETIDLGKVEVGVLLAKLSGEDMIYNVVLPRSPGKALLCDLDRRRDDFIPYQMLWWVHVSDLPICLQEWTQLRQLMSVYLLEDELLGNLRSEDIQADLDYLAQLDKGGGVSEAEEHLRRVLGVLRERATQ